MPLRVIWGEHGLVNKCFEPIEDWKQVAINVSGKSLPCGHYIPEELPDELIKEAKAFLVKF
jgi:haloacetate dehalogenase